MTSIYQGLARFMDGIPVVGTTASRNTRYPNTPLDFRVFNKETGAIERYTGAGWVADWQTTATMGAMPITATGSTTARTLQSRFAEVFNVKDFGAVGNGTTDDTAAIQSAITAANSYASSYASGAGVFLPPGGYRTTAELSLLPYVHLFGAGLVSTAIRVDHTGNGIRMTSPVNVTLPRFNVMSDFYISCVNTATSAGAGIVDEAGAFVWIDRVYVLGFAVCVVFDQTEHAAITRSTCDRRTETLAGLWIVNGPARRVGALPGFTNVISVSHTQFNGIAGVGNGIIDDGGATHEVRNCNFNAGLTGALLAGVSGLIYTNNEHEGYTQDVWVRSTQIGNAEVGPVGAMDMRGNVFSSICPYNILLDALTSSVIEANSFGQATIAAMHIRSPRVNGNRIGRQNKLITGTWRTPAPFINGTQANIFLNDLSELWVQTYVVASAVAGAGVVFTPATLGFPDTRNGELIQPGSRLFAINVDGTNGEVVTVTATTATTVTATLATSKAAGWLLYGVDGPLRAVTLLVDAATIALSAPFMEYGIVTLGGNRTMGAPNTARYGQSLTFTIIQDGTGGRTLAWAAVYKQVWSDAGNTAGKRSTISFIYDGTNWNQVGAQTGYV